MSHPPCFQSIQCPTPLVITINSLLSTCFLLLSIHHLLTWGSNLWPFAPKSLLSTTAPQTCSQSKYFLYACTCSSALLSTYFLLLSIHNVPNPGFEPMTFRSQAIAFNQLCYRRLLNATISATAVPVCWSRLLSTHFLLLSIHNVPNPGFDDLSLKSHCFQPTMLQPSRLLTQRFPSLTFTAWYTRAPNLLLSLCEFGIYEY